MTWLITHSSTLIEILVALHAVALLIVNLTPTPADNIILGRIYRFIEIAAGLLSLQAKALPGEKASQMRAKPAADMDEVDDWLERGP